MHNLDNILIKKILGFLDPHRFVYNDPNTIISSYTHGSIIDIALVCKHWFELISKMLTHLGIHITDNPYDIHYTRLGEKSEHRIYVYPYTDRFSYEYSYSIERLFMSPYKSVDFFKLLNAKHSLLNFNNITSFVLYKINPWHDVYNQLINRIIQNGQLKTFTIVSEISYLKFFIKLFKPTTFQYFVVPRITEFEKINHHNIAKEIQFLTKPKYNITWMETFISNNNGHPGNISIEENVNSNDLAKYLSAVEKAAPISPIRMRLSEIEDLGRLNDHLEQITSLRLYYVDTTDIVNIIKNSSLQLKELYINMAWEDSTPQNQLCELLKNNRSIDHLKIVGNVTGAAYIEHTFEFSKHFSDLLNVNTTLTRLSLNSLSHVREKFLQSLENNTTLRSLSISIFDCKIFEYLRNNKTLHKLKINYNFPNILDGMSGSIAKLLQSDTHNIKIIQLNQCFALESKPIEDAIYSVNNKKNFKKKIYLLVNYLFYRKLPKNSINGDDAITIKVLPMKITNQIPLE